MHFIESALSFKGHTFTSIIELKNVSDLKKIIPDYDKVLEFKDVLYEKDSNYSDKSFSKSIISSAAFLQRYELKSEKFNDDIEKISNNFEVNYKDRLDRKSCIKELEKSIIELLNDQHPTRYFSFIKAQCDLHIDKLEKKCFLVSDSYDSDFYPQGKTKEKLNNLWDDMWKQFKKGIDETLPINSSANLFISKNTTIKNINAFRLKYSDTKKTTLTNG